MVAVAVYVTVPAPSHLGDVVPIANTGEPTVGVVVTTWVDVLFGAHPIAVAVMVDVPVQPAAKVTAPVDEFIELPAKPAVVASKLYVILVLLAAVAV